MTLSSSVATVSPKTGFISADGLEIFYRHAGPSDAPTLLLLHGFPTTSHQYRNLMGVLAHKYRVIAPDLPGFGFTIVPKERKYEYTFVNFGKSIEGFVDALGLKKFALYIFDYGAPTGFYLSLARPDSVTGIITQNGNAYDEGLGPSWAPIQKYWADPTQSNRDAIKAALTPEAIKDQYTSGVPPSLLGSIDPASYTLDSGLFSIKPNNTNIQLDLFYDYRNNVKSYPKWQEFLRTKQPRVLAIWGSHDGFFIPAGAEAYKKDVKDIKVILLDTGHFAIETHLQEIAKEVEKFLG